MRFELGLRGIALLAVLLAAPVSFAHAEEPEWRHGGSLIGEPKYPAGFEHFDYVNPDAPKGGKVRFSADGTFDTFNWLIPRGTPAAGLTAFLYESLTTQALDESSSEYGLIAEAFRYPADYSWVEYRIRPDARWHDGEPIKPEDVVWSLEQLTKLNPNQAFYYRNVVKAEKVDDHTVRFTFDSKGNRELPKIVGQLNILPKHWWEGTGADGKKRDIESGSLEPPLGSGPYKIKSFVAGRSVTYERVADYWGANVPVNVGKHNFDEIVYEYFRDDTVELEAFKGDTFDWRIETSAKNWATAYDFPAAKEGRVILEEFPDIGSGGMQGFVFNLRKPKFQDPRVRRAFNLVFDFEEMNRTIFFGSYERSASYFAPTELASSGVPAGKELEILEEVRDLVPPEVFTTPYTNPVGGDPAKVRDNLREALKLFQEAGWQLKGRQLVDGKTGEPFTVEFLLASPTFARVAQPYSESLKRIGIEASVRSVDVSQYINRLRSKDFDMLAVFSWGQSLSPGNEQRDFWGTEAADRDGSRNVHGVKNPAVDKLIDRIIFAKDREELVAATRALDRVLLWNHYVVPQWHYGFFRTARWNRFARPETLPKYSPGFPTIWWWDAAKAAATGGRE